MIVGFKPLCTGVTSAGLSATAGAGNRCGKFTRCISPATCLPAGAGCTSAGTSEIDGPGKRCGSSASCGSLALKLAGWTVGASLGCTDFTVSRDFTDACAVAFGMLANRNGPAKKCGRPAANISADLVAAASLAAGGNLANCVSDWA